MSFRTIYIAVLIGFCVFCGGLVVESGFFRGQQSPPGAADGARSQADRQGVILLRQTTEAEPPSQPVEPNRPAGDDAPAPQLVPVVGQDYIAVGGTAVDVHIPIGSADPASGFKYRLMLTSKGAAIRAATLSQYYERESKPPEPLTFLSPVEVDSDTVLSLATTGLSLVDQRLRLPLDELDWAVLDGGVRKLANGGQAVSFEATVADSTGEPVLRLTKTYGIAPDSYLLDCNMVVANLIGNEQSLRFRMEGPAGIRREDPRTDGRKIIGGYRDPQERIESVRVNANRFGGRTTFAEEVLGGKQPEGLELLWVAAVNKYFAAILVPLPQGDRDFCDWITGRRTATGDREVTFRNKKGWRYSLARFFTGKSYQEAVAKTGKIVRFYNPDGQGGSGDENIAVELESDFITLGPKASQTYRFQLYLGPKEKSLFDQNELYRRLGFLQTIDLMPCCCCPSQIINPLAFGILAMMKWMHGFWPHNYGIVIIILVFVMRLLLHPITKYSQVSMHKMGKLAPRAEEIKKKYADNKAEMNKRLMELYREQGASPIMGMLPMFIQMPIWIALYSAVSASIDLRGAAFLPVWITDLSAPDALVSFPTITIPLLGKLHSLNLLPILMGVAFYLQQKLMPAQQAAAATNPQMAQQQKMMAIMMPLLFPLMLYNAPSGVNLYIMSSTFAGVIEQYVIRKHIRQKEQDEGRGVVSATSKTGGKVKKKKPKPFFRY